MLCYIADIVHGKSQRGLFRCLRWPRLYALAFGTAFLQTRIVLPLLQLLAMGLSPLHSTLLGPLVLMLVSAYGGITTYLCDAFFVKMILSGGTLSPKAMGSGLFPMLISRARLEARLALWAVLPLCATFALLALTRAGATAFQWKLILFTGETLLLGVSLYYVPLLMVCRYIHAAYDYYRENVQAPA